MSEIDLIKRINELQRQVDYLLRLERPTNADTLDGLQAADFATPYVTGTWTPGLGLSANLTGTPTVSQAVYVRIGRKVTFEVAITGLSVTASNTLTVLEFTVPLTRTSAGILVLGSAYTVSNNVVVAAALVHNGGNADNAYCQWMSGAQIGAVTIHLGGYYLQ